MAASISVHPSDQKCPPLFPEKSRTYPNCLEVLIELGLEWKEREIGRGIYGCVYLCLSSSTASYAVKVLNGERKIPSIRLRENGRIDRGEAINLYIPKHPALLETFGIILQGPDGYQFVQKLEKGCGGRLYAIVSEAILGAVSLLDLRKDPEFLANKIGFIRSIGSQLLEALEALHRAELMHRDLKGENILYIKKSDQVKLIDFGLSGDLAIKKRRKSYCGTPGYIAPEVMEERGYGACADLWSLGVMLYELYTGEFPPYVEKQENNEPAVRESTLKFIRNGLPISAYIQEKCLSEDFLDLLDHLICPEEGRLSASLAREHRFFN